MNLLNVRMYYTVRLNILPIGVEVVLDIDPSQRVVINTQTFSELIHELLNILNLLNILYLLNIIYLLNILYTAFLINPTLIAFVLFTLLGFVAFLSK